MLCTILITLYEPKQKKRVGRSLIHNTGNGKQVPLHPSSPPMIRLDKDLWKFGEGVTRRFSWQEAALIQTFPEGMKFAGDLTSKYRQIGNAVPVRLAKAIGDALVQTLDECLGDLPLRQVGS